MNRLTDSPEEAIFKELVKYPTGYTYIEQGRNFYEVTNDSGTYRISVVKKIKRKSKNRPRGLMGMEDLAKPT